MQFGRVDCPIDARHTMTASYAAADWEHIMQMGWSITMYLPGEVGSAFREALELRTADPGEPTLEERADQSIERDWEALKELADY